MIQGALNKDRWMSENDLNETFSRTTKLLKKYCNNFNVYCSIKTLFSSSIRAFFLLL